MKEVPPEIFRQLLDGSAPSAREVAERVAKARDEEYWRDLAGEPETLEESVAPAGRIASAVASYRRTGVYRIDAAVAPAALSRINAVVDRVLAAGWPAVFAFACDELWAAGRLNPVRAFVEEALGAGAKQLPHVWTHVVKAGGEQAGWPPHVDGPGANRLTAWIALGAAGIDNGCIYAVPRDAGASVTEWCDGDVLTKANVQALLQATTAMPAAAGDVLGWAFDILHWGGRVAAGSSGRRSLSLEFIGADAAPAPGDGTPVAIAGPLPSHGERIQAIAAGLAEYKKFEPLVRRYQAVARALLDGVNTIHGS